VHAPLRRVQTPPNRLQPAPGPLQVDDRLNGDGTGKPFGVNDPVLGWVIVGVSSGMWALWYNGQKDLGAFDDENDGLKIDDE
jgi:photosystem II PsbW protein